MRTHLLPLLLAALSASAWANPATPDVPSTERADCAAPEWPQAARQRGEHGTVTVALLVEADGKPSQAKVVKSSGHPLLDAAARDGLAKCSYPPLQVRGAPQMGWQLHEYTWKQEPGQ